MIFDKDDVKQLKTFGEPGLLLYGFKPLSALGDILNFKSPMFLYPNEVRCLATPGRTAVAYTVGW